MFTDKYSRGFTIIEIMMTLVIAGIVLAGSLVVIRILHYLKALELTVSMSGLLEGILIDNTEGVYNG